jgi:hypothetical protein
VSGEVWRFRHKVGRISLREMTDDTDLREAMRTVRGTWKVWVLLLVTVAIGSWGIQELYRDRENALSDLSKADTRATEKQAELVASDQEKNALREESKKLVEENAFLHPLKEREEADEKAKEEHAQLVEALKAGLAEKWKADVGRDVKLLPAGDKLAIEVGDRFLFDAPDSPALSKKGADAIAALAAGINEAKVSRVRVTVHGESFLGPIDKSKGASGSQATVNHAAQLARAIHEKTKGVEVEIAIPIAKNDRKRVDLELDWGGHPRP